MLYSKETGVRFMECDAVVFILLGQSNAVGHDLPMDEKDKLNLPLKNVFGLKRSLNQSFDITQITWDHYTSAGMNLAEEQDDTYSIVNCLASQWQKARDDGQDLPQLYIVQIAIGAQGVTEKYMWNPAYPQKLIPGKLGQVDISLHTFSRHILTLVHQDLKGRGISPRYMLHWRGGEEDMTMPEETLQNCLTGIYEQMFEDYLTALGGRASIKLHRIICEKRAVMMKAVGASVQSLHYNNRVFEELAEKHEHISVFDPCNYPGYAREIEHCGVFLDDEVHFTREVNQWVAGTIIRENKTIKIKMDESV